MCYLKNLSSQQIFKGIPPWEYKPAAPIPDEVRGDKDARDAWINLPTTDHHVYTFYEGVNSDLRISKARNDGEGNPVHSCWAFVADYDAKATLENVLKFASELPYSPNWIERTLSGNWRFVWLLEEPILFPSFEFARHFLKKFPEFAFDPARGMIGFDRGAWEAPERLWTNSCQWHHVHDKKIPADVTRGWLVKASQTYKFNTVEFGTAVPLEVAAAELAKLFPKFCQWPGDFTLNSQGPTFWIAASQSPKSAIVRETGIQTFSANATKAFYSWKELLGAAFVSEYEAKAVSRTVEGIYFDGRSYWRHSVEKKWIPENKPDLSLHLRNCRDVSSKYDKSGLSDVDRALSFIHEFQRVDAAAPFVFRPAGLINQDGKKVLNTSNVRVLQPAEGKQVWGVSGNFPWLSAFFDALTDEEQKQVIQAWIIWAYKGFYIQKPEGGQVLFLAGPQGVGKTLLNQSILGKLFGGFAEAKEFLLRQDNFNSELFGVGQWCVDDGSAGTDARLHRVFGEAIKGVAANPTFRCNEKFLKATKAEWLGRLCVTCNADPESIMFIPDLSISILDKLILIRKQETTVEFPPRYELDAILARELPYYAAWLLQQEIPKHLRGSARYGVKAYAEKSLVQTSQQSSKTAGFAEILENWKQDYFNVREPAKEDWEGTASQLYMQILQNPTAEVLMRPFSVDAVGRHLVQLSQKDRHIELIPSAKTRLWRIHRDGTAPGKPVISKETNV